MARSVAFGDLLAPEALESTHIPDTIACFL